MKNDDAKWVECILSGDEAAFTALVKKYEKQIHAFVWQRVRDYHVAEEITQDTFLKAYEKLSTLRDPNRFSGWLYMIATRRFLTWLDGKRIPMESLEAMSRAEIESLFYAEYMAKQTEKLTTEKQREVVEYLLQKLPARERTAVVLHYLSEMTCEEIGDFLDVSPNTIKSQLHRARQRLRKEEPIVRRTLGNFQSSDDLMDDVMKWVQVDEPGILGQVGTLSVTSENTLYAVIADESIYKLPADAEAWQLVNDTFLFQDTGGDIPIAEQDGTLYIILSHELFASTDSGENWHLIGPCPKWYVRELMITEDAFYLCLSGGIFRSDDAGNSWVAMNDGLDDRLLDRSGIHSLRIRQGTLFVRTDLGVYRLDGETWNHLQLPINDIWYVGALAVYEDQIYVMASVNILDFYGASKDIWERLLNGTERSWWIFRSTDAGDSWTDITPTDAWDLHGVMPLITLLAAGETLLAIGNSDGMVARSVDRGETWTTIESSGISPMQFSVHCAVALNENTFYTGGSSGIHRSTDGGKTWHRFHTGLKSRVDNLVNLAANQALNRSAALYARIGKNFVKSTDGGTSWDAVSLKANPRNPLHKKQQPEIVQIAKDNGILYAKGIQRGMETTIFRLSSEGNALIHVPVHSFNSGELMHEVLAGKHFIFRDKRRSGPELRIGFSGATDFKMAELSKNSDLGADRFFERLTQIQTDAPLAYELMWEGMWGSLAVSGETFYIEYNYKLFRWKTGDSEWQDTGVEEIGELSRDRLWIGFKIAAEDKTVYVGKRDCHLLQSLDGGDSWNDVTPYLPLPVAHFKEIILSDSFVYVATDTGVFNSKDGVTWNVLTGKSEEPVVIKALAAAENSIYGASDEGIYHLQSNTTTWEQVAPEISGVVTSLVVDEEMFYVGTERRGVLRFKRPE